MNWPQLLLLLGAVDKVEAPLAFAWRHVREHGYKLTKDGVVLQSDEENLAELGLMAEKFTTEQLPLLRKLGAVHVMPDYPGVLPC